MAQQNIDFGSFPNDPGADAIRTAFEKVQQNFTDLYTTTFSSGVTQVITGPGLNQTRPTGDVKISANIPNITIQTSSSLRVGVGVATGNTATISSWVTPFVIDLSGNITTTNANIGNITVANLNVTNRVTSSLVPSANVTYNLGSPTRRWKDLYLSGNTIDLGGTLISSDGTVIQLSSLLVTTAIVAPIVQVTESISSPLVNIGNTALSTANGAVVMPALQVGDTILSPVGLTVSGNLNAGNVNSAFVAGVLTTAEQPNIKKLGVLNSLDVAGDINTGDMNVLGNLTATGSLSVDGAFSAPTITGNVVIPPGASLQAPGSNGQITFNDGGNAAAVPGLTFDKTVNLLSIAGNVSGGNLVSTGALSLTKDANIGGNVKSANLLTGRVEATSIISSGGSNVVLDPAGTVSAIGNISGGNITTNGNVSTANLNATFIVSTGNANITGMMTTGNLTTTGAASITGNITGGNLVTSGLANIGGLITQGTANVGLLISTGHANVTGNVTAGNLTTNGTLSAGNLSTNGNLQAANVSVGAGLITAGNSNTTGTHTTTELVVSSNANIQGTHRALIGFTTGTHTAGNFFTTGEANVGSHIAGTSVTTGLHTSNQLKVDLDAEITGNGKLGNANVVGLLTTLSANVTGTHAAQTSVTRGLHTANTLTVNLDAEITGNGKLGNANVLGLFTSVDANITGLHKAATSETIGTHTARDLKINVDAEITGNSTHGNANVLGTLTTLNSNIRGYANAENSVIRGTHTANTLTINLNASVSGSHTVGTTGANVVMSAGDLTMTGRHTAANANVSGIHYVGDNTSNVSISAGNITMTGRHTAANANVSGTHYVGNNTNNVSISNGNITMTGRHTAANANVSGTHYVGDNTSNVSISNGNINMTGTHNAGYIVIDVDSETKRNHKTANLQVTNNANFDANMFVTRDANVGNLKVRGDHTIDGNTISDKFRGNSATFGATPGDPGTSLTVNGVVSIQGNANIGNISAINSVTGNIISLSGNATGSALVAAGLVRVGGNHAVTQNISVGVALPITSASVGAGQLALTFRDVQSIPPFHIGQKVILTGFAPPGYNIEYTVTELLGTPGNYTGIKVPTSLSSPVTQTGLVTTAGNALTVSGNLVGASMILTGSHNVTGKVTSSNLEVTSGQANFQGGLKSLDGTFNGKVDINGNATLYADGNITGKTFTATLFSGSGEGLTSVPGANITGTINALSKLSNLQEAVQGLSTLEVAKATSSGSITTVNGLPSGSYSNITGVGTLGSLTVTGTVLGDTFGNSTSKFTGNGASLTNVTAAKVPASGITGQTGMWSSADRPGATRLYRRDVDNNYSVQVHKADSYWFMRGYNDSTFDAEVRVGYADNAGAVPWSGVSSKPTFFDGAFSSLTGKPTTIVGYGITDAYTGPPQGIATTSKPQFDGLGIGVAASTTAGEIRATNNITAYYSDDRLKTKLGAIENALDKIDELSGFYYEENELAVSLGYKKQRQIGVSAQQVQNQLPDCGVVVPAPIDEKYLTVRYEKLIPLLIEGIKELRIEIKEIKNTLEGKK